MALKKIHTISLKRRAGKDEFAEPTFADATTFDARWNDEVKEFIDSNGAQLVSVATIFYTPDVTLAVGDHVKKDGEYQPIRAIAQYPNGSGSRQINVAYLSANVR